MPTGPKEHADDLPRMVYVGNLAWSVKWQDLKDHMKQAGTVEFCRILTFDGSDWGRSRGMAYVRYETEAEAQAAVAALNTSELAGRAITVDPWTGAKPRTGPPKGSGKGYFFVKGGGKEGHKGGFQMGAKGWGKGWGKNVQVHGDNSQMVYVANLPFKAEWQEVKDHFKSVGTVEFVKILTQDGTEYGQSKGIACVRFTTAAEADQAVAQLNGSEMSGRNITVDKWSSSGTPQPEAAAASV
mmetsp:Transcript_11032/g.38899  ORF Transcript_11032/g.38899 Transcript_11032/m.38899 type:complete len:241 (-) Transcript_11032:56-778(-)